jgi:formylglycine-generating enzyme required for sulfatase activity
VRRGQIQFLILWSIFVGHSGAQLAGPSNTPRRFKSVSVERRMALVVGNSNYSVGKVNSAVSDATALELTLKKLRFQVTTLRDASYSQMQRELDRFSASLQKGDLALFYFAGHGMQIERANYLVPIDFRVQRLSYAKQETLATEQVRQQLERSKASLRVIVLDACRRNPFVALGGGRAEGLREMPLSPGTLWAFAAGAEAVAEDDSTETNGLYARSLMAALQTPGLTLGEVFQRVQREIQSQSAGGRQNPTYYNGIVGPVVLNGGMGSGPLDAAMHQPPVNGNLMPNPPSKTAERPVKEEAVKEEAVKEEAVYWKECQSQRGAFCEAYFEFVLRNRFPALAKLVLKAPRSSSKDKKVDSEEPTRDGLSSLVPSWLKFASPSGPTKGGPEGIVYVWVPPGTFWMGCSSGDTECESNEPNREVQIAKGFWIGQTEVTQKVYEQVRGSNPSAFRGALRPVESVSWMQAREFCLTIGARLPYEDEWEYAARAGSKDSRYGPLDSVAWYDANGGNQTQVVAQKTPNAWGLYDMLGNVWEWTASVYTTKSMVSRGESLVLRGGGWSSSSSNVRASLRGSGALETSNRFFGFRCVRDSL